MNEKLVQGVLAYSKRVEEGLFYLTEEIQAISEEQDIDVDDLFEVIRQSVVEGRAIRKFVEQFENQQDDQNYDNRQSQYEDDYEEEEEKPEPEQDMAGIILGQTAPNNAEGNDINELLRFGVSLQTIQLAAAGDPDAIDEVEQARDDIEWEKENPQQDDENYYGDPYHIPRDKQGKGIGGFDYSW